VILCTNVGISGTQLETASRKPLVTIVPFAPGRHPVATPNRIIHTLTRVVLGGSWRKEERIVRSPHHLAGFEFTPGIRYQETGEAVAGREEIDSSGCSGYADSFRDKADALACCASIAIGGLSSEVDGSGRPEWRSGSS
jgi:hypothetical protein